MVPGNMRKALPQSTVILVSNCLTFHGKLESSLKDDNEA